MICIIKYRYLFLGYEDAENKRLLFDQSSMALEWKERWNRNIAVSAYQINKSFMVFLKAGNFDIRWRIKNAHNGSLQLHYIVKPRLI